MRWTLKESLLAAFVPFLASILLSGFLIACSLTAPTSTATPLPSGDGVVDGWAILAEKDDYADVGMSDLPVGYANIIRLHQLLLDSGWQDSRIRDLREFDRDDLTQALDWLEANADDDDLVLFYVASHGSYLREVVCWNDFFADEWAEVPGKHRVLVVDACRAAVFTAAVRADPRPHLTIAAVAGNEYGWSGLPEEELPIIGGVFTHYFAAAFADPGADADSDGTVSFQEAAEHAEGQQRTYMHEVVFAVPEFAEMYPVAGDYHPADDPEFPHVVVEDTAGEPIYMAPSGE
jgi:hypothetical protein